VTKCDRALPFVLGLLALVLAVSCSPTPEDAATAEAVEATEAAIINGQSCASTSDHSALAMILTGEIQSPWGQNMPLTMLACTGTLIAPDVVLTAGHCVHSHKMVEMMGAKIANLKYYVSFQADLAALAESGMGPGGPAQLPADAVEVKAFVAHPDFDLSKLGGGGPGGPGGGGTTMPAKGLTDQFNDIGLLFLASEVTTVEPAVVLDTAESSQLIQQAKVRIVGYGQTSPQQSNPYNPGGGASAGIRTCADTFVNEVGPAELQIGAGPETGRKCHGDSGGPSYMTVTTEHDRKVRVVGVTSRAYDPQADCYVGGVDSRVDYHHKWLDDQMTKHCDGGVRVWCDVKGIIPPSHYDKPKEEPKQEPKEEPKEEPKKEPAQPKEEPTPKTEPANPNNPGAPGQPGTGEDPTVSEGGGCQLTPTPPSLIGLLPLFALGLLRRRRRR